LLGFMATGQSVEFSRDEILCIAFHPRKPIVAYAGRMSTTKIYDLAKRQYIAKLPQAGLIGNIAFSVPNGRFLATSKKSVDKDGFDMHEVILWNANDKFRYVKTDHKGEEVKSKGSEAKRDVNLLHRDEIVSMCFGPTRRKLGIYPVLMSASKDGNIRLWDYRRQKDGRRFNCLFTEGRSSVDSATLSKDGLLLAAITQVRRLHLWKINHSESKTIPIMEFKFDKPGLTLSEFLPAAHPDIDHNDPRRLGAKYQVAIAGTETLRTKRTRGAILLIEFFDTDSEVAGGPVEGGGRTAEGAILQIGASASAGKKKEKAVFRTQFSNDDKRQAAKVVARYTFDGHVHAIAVSPNGDFIAGGITSKSAQGESQAAVLWSKSGRKLNTMVVGLHEKEICDVQMLPLDAAWALQGGKHLAKGLSLIGSAGFDETFRVWKWDMAYGALVDREKMQDPTDKKAEESTTKATSEVNLHAALPKNPAMPLTEVIFKPGEDGISVFDKNGNQLDGDVRELALHRLIAGARESRSSSLFLEVAHAPTTYQAVNEILAVGSDGRESRQRFKAGEIVKARYHSSTEIYDCIVLDTELIRHPPTKP